MNTAKWLHGSPLCPWHVGRRTCLTHRPGAGRSRKICPKATRFLPKKTKMYIKNQQTKTNCRINTPNTSNTPTKTQKNHEPETPSQIVPSVFGSPHRGRGTTNRCMALTDRTGVHPTVSRGGWMLHLMLQKATYFGRLGQPHESPWIQSAPPKSHKVGSSFPKELDYRSFWLKTKWF